jgi:hypothetical protein
MTPSCGLFAVLIRLRISAIKEICSRLTTVAHNGGRKQDGDDVNCQQE